MRWPSSASRNCEISAPAGLKAMAAAAAFPIGVPPRKARTKPANQTGERRRRDGLTCPHPSPRRTAQVAASRLACGEEASGELICQALNEMTLVPGNELHHTRFVNRRIRARLV